MARTKIKKDLNSTTVELGDIVNYGFYKDVEIHTEDELHYILMKNGTTKKVYKYLVVGNATNIRRGDDLFDAYNG